MNIHTQIKKILSDTYTPVSLYLSLRDHYQQPLLLESCDYNSREGHYSYVCLKPFADISLANSVLTQRNGSKETSLSIYSSQVLLHELNTFQRSIQFHDQPYPFCYAGMFGFMGYDAIPNFEEIQFEKAKELDLPEMYYAFYSLLLVFDHQSDSLYLISHANTIEECELQLTELENKISSAKKVEYPFVAIGEVTSNYTDEEFKYLVERAKEHCQAGDVFQLVLSKRFKQQFIGDEFNVYRALRNLNPSPYLFYFDLGNYKLFGSSPEAQLVLDHETAEIHPIAGTYKRTGDDAHDAQQASMLFHDPKERSEHMMLVDLARNDLSKYCNEVVVKKMAEVQFYSHVIHLVSKVVGKLKKDVPFEVLTGTFPAGTLSGAPKYRALQLIDEMENVSRQFYGGCIGFISHCGKVNHAIMIRTFLSKDQTLVYQAGAGIVIQSIPENENNEIYNKVGALKKAIERAENINNSLKTIDHEIISLG